MSEIPKYLINNPDYYIKWWKRSSDIILKNKNQIDSILNGYKIEECIIPPWYSWFKLKKDGNDIWYISYYIENDHLKIKYVKINNGDNKFKSFNNETNYQWQWYAKKLYLWVAIEAKKRGLIFTSDYQSYIKDKAKFIWNSLVHDWLVIYKNKRFYFINENLP